jgi:C-terminal peptidase prc
MSDPQPLTRRTILLSALFSTLIVILTGGMAVYVLADRNISEALILARAAFSIDRLYQERVDWERLQTAGIDGILSELDRYSTYHEPRQFDRIHEELSGSYIGIGVSVIGHQEGLMVMSVRENGPAAEVGMLSGDVIFRVDSTVLSGYDIDAATYLLRGPEGTTVRCRTYRAATDDTLEFVITRRNIAFVHIPYAGLTPDSVIYVRLLDFDAGASHDLALALDSLMSLEGAKPRGLILDLRDNPGGLYDEAYKTVNLFLESGQFIVGTKGRSRWDNEEHYSTGRDITGGLPMAVIVDQGSASSAEITAGALRYLNRAVLVGDTTFGKGLVQGFTSYLDGSALRLTIARYYLPGGVYLNEIDSTNQDIGHGLAPDYFFKFIERDAFPLTLEHSLVLSNFATQHQDEILAATDQFGLDDSWVVRFAEYAAAQGFDYCSPITLAAEALKETGRQELAGASVEKSIASLLADAQADDLRQFTQYGQYIKMRLKQLAYERRFGSSEAYARVIVPDRPDIQFTARLLRGQN